MVKSWFMYDDYLGTNTLRCAYRNAKGYWDYVKCDEEKNLSDPVLVMFAVLKVMRS